MSITFHGFFDFENVDCSPKVFKILAIGDLRFLRPAFWYRNLDGAMFVRSIESLALVELRKTLCDIP